MLGDLENGISSGVENQSKALSLRRVKELWTRGRIYALLLAVIFFCLCSLLLPSMTTKDSKGLDRVRIEGFPPSAAQLDQLNLLLGKFSADDILKWAHSQLPQGLIQVTSFGPSGLVVLDKLRKLGLLSHVSVLTIDTLHLFPESYAFIKSMKIEIPEMHLHVYQPQNFRSRNAFDQQYGESFWKKSPDEYAYFSKVEPMVRGLKEMNTSGWITGRRRSQGAERASLPVVEIDNLDPMRIKINPLAYWTYEDVWKYIRDARLLYNPLHDEGYKSIGDTMTTKPVDAAASERSGRFVGMQKTECGMHIHFEKIEKMRQDARKKNQVFEMPKLPCDGCLEVDMSNFDQLVLGGQIDMLIEFYSPMCSHCQNFAPKYDVVLKKLKSIPDVEVARMDITIHKIPESGKAAGFKVDSFPALYLVQRTPFKAILYTGEHEVSPILDWLEWKTSYVRVSDL